MLNYQRLNHHFFRPNPHFWDHRTGAPSSLNSRCPFCRTLSGLLPPSGDTNPVAGKSPSSMTVACAEEIVRTRWWIFRLLWLIYRMVNMVLWWFRSEKLGLWFMQPEHSGRNGTSPDLYTPDKLEPTRKMAIHQKLRGNLARENEKLWKCDRQVGINDEKHEIEWFCALLICRGEICFKKMVHGLPPSTKRIKEWSSHCHVCVLAANQFESDVYKPKKYATTVTSNIEHSKHVVSNTRRSFSVQFLADDHHMFSRASCWPLLTC